MYVPVHADEDGEIIAVSEFYQDPTELEPEVSSSQRKGWLVVATAPGPQAPVRIPGQAV